MNSPPPLLIIAGPTAVGKTALAIETALALGGEIISADSMQIYRGMAIGTAQPSAEELGRVPHHLVGCIEPGEEFNVARFLRDAEACIDQIRARGRVPVVCGGTGLFLRALKLGIFDGPGRDEAIRNRLMAQRAAEGLESLRRKLREVDPERDAQIAANDGVRVIRALEIFELTGRPMSAWLEEDRLSRRERPTRLVVLTRERGELEQRIEQRVRAMIAAGWIDEARALLGRELPPESQPLKALGYRTLFDHVAGRISLDEAIARICLETRQFAKRQMTWMRQLQDEVIDLSSEREPLRRLLRA